MSRAIYATLDATRVPLFYTSVSRDDTFQMDAFATKMQPKSFAFSFIDVCDVYYYDSDCEFISFTG